MTPYRPTGEPPVPSYDQKPMLWTTGGILTVVGLSMAFLDNPLVPLTHVFHLIPIGVGGAIGTAILREKYGARWMWGYGIFAAWLVFATLSAQTSGGIVFLAAGLFNLTRAIVQTAAVLET